MGRRWDHTTPWSPHKPTECTIQGHQRAAKQAGCTTLKMTWAPPSPQHSRSFKKVLCYAEEDPKHPMSQRWTSCSTNATTSIGRLCVVHRSGRRQATQRQAGQGAESKAPDCIKEGDQTDTWGGLGANLWHACQMVGPYFQRSCSSTLHPYC